MGLKSLIKWSTNTKVDGGGQRNNVSKTCNVGQGIVCRSPHLSTDFNGVNLVLYLLAEHIKATNPQIDEEFGMASGKGISSQKSRKSRFCQKKVIMRGKRMSMQVNKVQYSPRISVPSIWSYGSNAYRWWKLKQFARSSEELL